MKPRATDLSTSRLLTLIRNAVNPEQAGAYSSGHPAPLFKDALYELMQQKHLRTKQVIIDSGIEKSYFYRILSRGQLPGRSMTIRLALSLGCDLKETNRLLRLAEHSELYPRVSRDAMLIWGITHGLSMSEINELLIQKGEAALYHDK